MLDMMGLAPAKPDAQGDSVLTLTVALEDSRRLRQMCKAWAYARAHMFTIYRPGRITLTEATRRAWLQAPALIKIFPRCLARSAYLDARAAIEAGSHALYDPSKSYPVVIKPMGSKFAWVPADIDLDDYDPLDDDEPPRDGDLVLWPTRMEPLKGLVVGGDMPYPGILTPPTIIIEADMPAGVFTTNLVWSAADLTPDEVAYVTDRTINFGYEHSLGRTVIQGDQS